MSESSRVANLSLEDVLALKKRLDVIRGEKTEDPIEKPTRPRDLPLSFAQERLWFLDQLGLVGTAYNVPLALHLEGQLDRAALEMSFRELVRRHESLRTRFTSLEGEAVQVIDAPPEEILEFIDLSGLEEAQRSFQLQQLQQDGVTRPFDLSKAPLFRAMLVRLAASEHMLLATLHHINSDGWSLMGVLRTELSALYTAFADGRSSTLPELPMQYADYALWQRQWLKGQVFQRQLHYWKKKLSGASGVLELPTDHERPSVPSYRGSVVPIQVDASVTQQLLVLAREEGATLYMVILAALQVLLYRWSGQRDVIVGSPIAGRTHPQADNLIGFFANTVMMRTEVVSSHTFRELLREVKETTLGALAHQDMPFEKLVAELQPNRDLSRQPLFQVAFGLNNVPEAPWHLSGLRVKPVYGDHVTARFDLSLFLKEADGGIGGAFEYATDLWERSTIERWRSHLNHLLQQIAADADRAIGRIEILGEGERNQLLVEWNDTDRDYRRDSTVVELFEERVRSIPQAAAVVCGEKRISYQELNERSNRLAHYLRKHGVGPDSLVGVCVERSVKMAVAVLGILKAGGAYVPLDEHEPSEHLHRWIVTDRARADRERLDVHLIDLHQEYVDCSQMNPSPVCSAENLAYVMYRKDSADKPTAVGVTHRAVRRFARAHPALAADADSCILSTAPLTSDAFTLDLWGALLNGATLSLQTCVEANRAPWFTASVFTAVDGLKALAGYGPTETAALAGMHEARQTHAQGSPMRIGRPVANMQMYVLDDEQELAPIGTIGELYIGGEGLARGYLNSAGRTAQKFIADPYGKRGGERLYRTGDRVRYCADGELEFVGRAGRQVKLHGHRIELGVIEAALRNTAGIEDCALLVRNDEHGESRLVAYIVAPTLLATGVPVGQIIRSRLLNRLPQHALPAAYMPLERLPQTESGQLELSRLPAPNFEEQIAQQYVPPRTPVEEMLVDIWKELLQQDRVGTQDNFFELGGHSLLAGSLISRVQKQFGIELPLVALFETPTIEALAERIEKIRRGVPGSATPTLLPQRRTGPVPMSFAQERLWALDAAGFVQNLHHAQYLNGPLDVQALQSGLRELVRRHEIFRTRFITRGREVMQIIDPDSAFALEHHDLSSLAGELREARVMQLAQERIFAPFDLSEGHGFRAVLIRLSADRHAFALSMHHVICDDATVAAASRELRSIYSCITRGAPISIPAPELQYADYALWQRNWLQGRVLDEHLRHWGAELDGVSPLILGSVPDRWRFPLADERQRRARAFHFGPALKGTTFFLPDDTWVALKSVSARAQVTPTTVVLAALAVVISEWSGQRRLAIAHMSHGRLLPALSPVLGPFAMPVPLRVSLEGRQTFLDVLTETWTWYRKSTMDPALSMSIQAAFDPSAPLCGVLVDQFMEGPATRGVPTASDGWPATEPMQIAQPHQGARRRWWFQLGITPTEMQNKLMVGCVFADPEFNDAAAIDWFGAAFDGVLRAVAIDPQLRLAP